jgi:ABC-type lipoprotein release transport system permease subunit
MDDAGLFAFIRGCLASLVPSVRGALVEPAEVLRDE